MKKIKLEPVDYFLCVICNIHCFLLYLVLYGIGLPDKTAGSIACVFFLLRLKMTLTETLNGYKMDHLEEYNNDLYSKLDDMETQLKKQNLLEE